MWTDLFKPAASCTSKPDANSVVRIEDLSMATSALAPAKAMVHTGTVVESNGRAHLCKADTMDTSHRVSVSTLTGIAPNTLPACAAKPVTRAPSKSTCSTPSTPGKYCSLMTNAERNLLLEQFDLETVRAEMAAPSTDRYTPGELHRTVNVAWRLVTVEGLDFNTAMAKAAKWIVTQPMHRDELSFADVLTFSWEAK